MIRKLSAHYILPVTSPPIKFGILTCNSYGEIIEISGNGEFREVASLEFYDGIIVPGFPALPGETSESLFIQLKLQFQDNPGLTLSEAFRSRGLALEVGTAPGINIIFPVDFARMRLTPTSRLRALIQGKRI